MKSIFQIWHFLTGQHLCFYLFNRSSSNTTQNNDSSTHIHNENKQVGASDGSIGVGANGSFNSGLQVHGGNVSLESADKDVLLAAGDALRGAAETATGAAKDALDFSKDGLDAAYRAAGETQEMANNLVRQTNELLAGTVGAKTNDSATQVAKDTQRNLLIALVVSVTGYGLLQYFKTKKS